MPARPDFAPPRPDADAFPPEISAGKSLLATLYGAFGLKRQAQELTAPERQAARNRHLAALQAHDQARAAFEASERARLTPGVLGAYRRRRVAALLESAATEGVGESFALAGRAEMQLFAVLARHFPNRILRRRLLVGRPTYHPDFLYVDPAHRLRIDLELDEPYGLGHRLPLHFVEPGADGQGHRSGDEVRDDAFLAAGWPVIRFSEQQAVAHPDGCARVVADLVERLTGQPTPGLADVLPVSPHPRWTREEANRMAAADTRLQLTAHLERIDEKPTARPRRVFVPSVHQQRIFDFLASGSGHGLVTAVAGSGKSTTLLEAVQVIRRRQPRTRIAMLAFNRSICNELGSRLAEVGIGDVETATLNGFGMRVLNLHRRGVTVDRHKAAGMLAQAATEVRGRRLTPDELTCARNLYEKFQSYVHFDPADPERYAQLARQYNAPEAEALQPVVARALDLTVVTYQARNLISLDEQNYLPVRLKLPVRPYDFVFVDECQDLTQTQLELVRMAAGEHGRLLFVGDPRQAIMGFRGADNQSVENIRALPGPPQELALTVSYRCPQTHVRRAQALIPAIEAAPGAAEGEVFEVGWAQAFHYVQERDLLFARNNDLVHQTVLDLLARGLTLDYEAGVVARPDVPGEEAEQSDPGQVARVVKALRAAVTRFDPAQAPVTRPTPGRQDEPLKVLLPWVLGRLHAQAQHWDGHAFKDFVEAVTAPDPRLGVRVSSAHQAKGLEANRVFVMGYPLFARPRQDQQAWEQQQEENLKYVALTRARQTLYLVGLP
jgi:DNA helicase II / ATP-dependent DNA helicase PcrA